MCYDDPISCYMVHYFRLTEDDCCCCCCFFWCSKSRARLSWTSFPIWVIVSPPGPLILSGSRVELVGGLLVLGLLVLATCDVLKSICRFRPCLRINVIPVTPEFENRRARELNPTDVNVFVRAKDAIVWCNVKEFEAFGANSHKKLKK